MKLGKKIFLGALCLLFLVSQNIQADNPGKGQLVWRGSRLSAVVAEGSWSDIGAQATELSNVAPQDSAAYALNNMIDTQIKDYYKNPVLVWLVNMYLDLDVFNPLKGHILPEDEAMMKTISQKSKIPYNFLQKGFVIADAVGQLMLKRVKSTRNLSSIQACSSFVAYGPRTASGERIFGRNLDYPSIGTIDSALTVYLLKPENGYQIMSIAPEGFPIVGLSAMNEKGLVIALHDAFSRNLSHSGTPIFSANREVMEHASSIEEAIQIYQKYQYGSGWLIHISDTDPKTHAPRGAVIELSGLGVTYKFDQNSFSSVTNFYQTPEQRAQELFISAGSEFHNQDRINRLNQLVSAQPVTVESAMNILSDTYSPSAKGDVDYSHGGIRAVDQVTSMIFLPDQGKILVAEGQDPASLGAYYEFSFDQMNRGEAPRKIRDALPVPQSFAEVVQAFKSEFQEADHYGSYQHLLAANKAASDCSISLLAGSASLHFGDYSGAESLLGTAMNCPAYNSHQKAIAGLLHGLIAWSQQDGDVALQEIQDARDAETDLKRVAGVPGNRDFVHFADDVLQRIQKGDKPSLQWISDKSRLDIKTGDNVGEWE